MCRDYIAASELSQNGIVRHGELDNFKPDSEIGENADTGRLRTLWIRGDMGDASASEDTKNGLFSKRLILRAAKLPRFFAGSVIKPATYGAYLEPVRASLKRWWGFMANL